MRASRLPSSRRVLNLLSVLLPVVWSGLASAEIKVSIDGQCVPAAQLLRLCGDQLQQAIQSDANQPLGYEPEEGVTTIEMDTPTSCAFYKPWVAVGGLVLSTYPDDPRGRVAGSVCTPQTDPPNCEDKVDNPISAVKANKYQHEIDFQSRSAPEVKVERWYNSNTGDWVFYPSLAFDKHVSSGQWDRVYATRPNGRMLFFDRQGGNFITNASSTESLEYQPEPGITWRFTTQTGVEHYDAQGRVVYRNFGDGAELTYTYNGDAIDVDNQRGRIFTITTEPDVPDDIYTWAPNFDDTYIPRRVAKITTVGGSEYHYLYDSEGLLTAVVLPDDTPSDLSNNPTRQYHYADSPPDANGDIKFPNLLHGITDARGHRYIEWGYDSEGRANRSTKFDLSGGNPCACTAASCLGVCSELSTHTIVFNHGASSGTSTVTNPYGKETIFHYTHWVHNGVDTGIRLITHIEGVALNSCQASSAYRSYYAHNGLLHSATDAEGNVTLYEYYPDGRLFRKTEGLKWSGSSPQSGVVSTTSPVNTTNATREVTYCWKAGVDKPIREIHENKVIKREFDQGHLVKLEEMARYQDDTVCAEGGADNGAHRYWRISKLNFTSGVPDFFEVAELEFSSGADIDNHTVLSLGALVSSNYPALSNNGGLVACFDGNPGNSCVFQGTDAAAADFAITFDMGFNNETNFAFFREAAFDNLSRFVTGLTVSYSDDGVLWVDKVTLSGLSAATMDWTGYRELVSGTEVTPTSGGGQPPSGDNEAHQYWRMTELTFSSTPDYLEVSELEFSIGDASSGYTVMDVNTLVSSNYSPLSASYDTPLCFDGSTSSRCIFHGADATAPNFAFTIDFGVGNEQNLTQFREASYDNLGRFITGFRLQFSDDGSTWTTRKVVSGLSVSGSYQWTQPVDLTGGSSPPPPPPADPDAHAYWRISELTFNASPPDYLEVAEFEFSTGDASSGYTVLDVSGAVFSNYPTLNSSSYSLQKCFDGSTSTRCIFTGANATSSDFAITIQLGAGNEQNLTQFREASFDNLGRFVTGFRLEYSDDGSTWSTKTVVSGLSVSGNYQWTTAVDLTQ